MNWSTEISKNSTYIVSERREGAPGLQDLFFPIFFLYIHVHLFYFNVHLDHEDINLYNLLQHLLLLQNFGSHSKVSVISPHSETLFLVFTHLFAELYEQKLQSDHAEMVQLASSKPAQRVLFLIHSPSDQ